MNSFRDFLEAHRVKKGEEKEITHTSMDFPKGRFYFGEEDMKQFYKVYKNAPERHLIERHTEYGPLVIDFDLKFPLEEKVERKYKESDITTILDMYRTEIKNMFQIKNKDKLTAYVFERDEPYISKKKDGTPDCIKDGIHIIFRNIVSKPEIQYVIRTNVIKRAVDAKLFDGYGILNTMTDVIDILVIEKNGWMVYGSTKPGKKPYVLTKIFDHTNTKLDLQTFLGDKNLVKFFSIRKKDGSKQTQLTQFGESQLNDYTKKKQIKKEKKAVSRLTVQYHIEEIRSLVNMLSMERLNNYLTWLHVGWCLHCINPEDDDLLTIWIDFTKKSEKFQDEQYCIDKWRSFENRGMTIGTLKYWAKEDNPDEYAKFRSYGLKQFIEKSITCTNYDVARVLKEMYKDNFVCVSPKKNIWYEFTNHKWNEVDSGISLRKKISNEMVDEYIKIIAEYNSRSELDDGDTDEQADEKQKYSKIALKFVELTYQLKTTSFKDNIMKEAKELFFDGKFVDKLDTNLNLIGFENGIYDLDAHELRDGKPEDYVSLSTKIEYIPKEQWDPEIVNQIEVFLSQVFIDKDIRQYQRRVLASCLHGSTQDQMAHFCTGVGANGKGLLKEIFINGFGEYCINLPITLLTSHRAKSNAASPELVQAKGKRFAYLDEPDAGDKINAGLFKALTGNDVISTRGLYSNQIEFKPQFKVVVICNDKPELPPNDEAVWRRTCVINYLSKFVDNPNPNNQYEFKKDRTLYEKSKKWSQTFISMLIEDYIEYKQIGLAPPPQILEFTKEYQRANNAFVEFIETQFETADASTKTKIKDIWNDLQDYVSKEGIIVPKNFSQKDLQKYITNAFKDVKIKAGYVYGMKYKEAQKL